MYSIEHFGKCEESKHDPVVIKLLSSHRQTDKQKVHTYILVDVHRRAEHDGTCCFTLHESKFGHHYLLRHSDGLGSVTITY